MRKMNEQAGQFLQFSVRSKTCDHCHDTGDFKTYRQDVEL